jgi:tetratricopeptide (TPR) repeat protein
VLDFHALNRPVRTASVWQVRQPLYTSSKARWQRYRRHLKPLIAAASRNIAYDRIDMVTLPEPGWLNVGVDCYRQGELDAAESCFKKLLHYLPDHAAARFMLGLIYVRKGHRGNGIPLMEQAVERCPWNRLWRADLQAYRLDGRDHDAAALARTRDHQVALPPELHAAEEPSIRLDYLFLSGESTCSSSGYAVFGAPC